MVPVLTAAEMRAADRRTIEEVGLPGAVLMENAGAAAARALRERYPSARRIAVLCGKGNNGGDGFVLARHLREREVRVFLIADRAEVKGDARLHLGVFERSGGTLTEVKEPAAWPAARERVLQADVVVDALLGTGLAQAPSGLVAEVIADLAAARVSPPVVAVDIPSGISSDGGDLPWPTISAALTVTFAAPKYGHVLPPACNRVGELLVADIGIPVSIVLESAPRLWLLEATDATAAYGRREPGSHKGTYGHLLVVAGSVGKTGAAVLTATAALRAGAGLVTVATPAAALPQVAAGRAEVMTEPLPPAPDGGLGSHALERALVLARERDAVVLGPGLGQERGTRDFVRELVRRCPVPLLVDADGLNALAAAPTAGVAVGTGALRREAATVVTPHPGEMGRLIGTTAGEVQRRRLETARALALESGAVVVLKGQRTIVADAGGRAAVNPTGNPGMATGGTGDALSGIIGALLARGREPWIAATAAVYLHGLAGDLAASSLGQEAMLAGDLIDLLPEVLRRVGSGHP